MALGTTSAGTWNLTCEQGATFIRDVNGWTIDDVAEPITGYTIRMQVRRQPSSSSYELYIDNASRGGIAITNGALGAYRITLTAAQTAALDVGIHYYDIEITDGTLVTRHLKGTFTVDPEVTR